MSRSTLTSGSGMRMKSPPFRGSTSGFDAAGRCQSPFTAQSKGQVAHTVLNAKASASLMTRLVYQHWGTHRQSYAVAWEKQQTCAASLRLHSVATPLNQAGYDIRVQYKSRCNSVLCSARVRPVTAVGTLTQIHMVCVHCKYVISTKPPELSPPKRLTTIQTEVCCWDHEVCAFSSHMQVPDSV